MNNSNSLVKQVPPQPLTQAHTGPLDIQANQPLIIYVQQAPEGAREDDRPSHYQTGLSRGSKPAHLPQLQLPSLLTISISLVLMTMFLVAASMFSISLTAYSNSVDRYDRQNSNQFLYTE